MTVTVPGLGIAVPALVPPALAAIAALLLAPTATAAVAYISGTLGTLIGGDLLHLRGLRDLGASVASIGGAGTFDGVFLSGDHGGGAGRPHLTATRELMRRPAAATSGCGRVRR